MRIENRQRLVVGNWKLNGNLAENAALLGACANAEVRVARTLGVCSPYPYLSQLQSVLANTPVQYGSQDVSRFPKGAYTGEVSAGMVAEFGCQLAIVGHSERRALFGDSDEVVGEKFLRAQQAGLTPVLCVGETLSEREAGMTEVVVARQVGAVIKIAGVAALAGAVVAYEPVWAIGTGKTASPVQAQEVHAFLRTYVAKHAVEISSKLPILYGGSVKKANAAELFGQPDIDGGLIGGASLVADEFLGIWQAL
jgi:triosephosphate isomerase